MPSNWTELQKVFHTAARQRLSPERPGTTHTSTALPSAFLVILGPNHAEAQRISPRINICEGLAGSSTEQRCLPP